MRPDAGREVWQPAPAVSEDVCFTLGRGHCPVAGERQLRARIGQSESALSAREAHNLGLFSVPFGSVASLPLSIARSCEPHIPGTSIAVKAELERLFLNRTGYRCSTNYHCVLLKRDPTIYVD